MAVSNARMKSSSPRPQAGRPPGLPGRPVSALRPVNSRQNGNGRVIPVSAPKAAVRTAPPIRPPLPSKPSFDGKPVNGKVLAPTGASKAPNGASKQPNSPDEDKILFQHYIKSVNPARTYAAQLKQAVNGNQYLVLTEGKRDAETDEVHKHRLFIFSEDFVQYFRMLHETAKWIKANPLPEEFRKKRERHWAKQNQKSK